MKTKKEYIAPVLTVVSFKVEQGFATSGVSSINLFHEVEENPFEDHYNTNNQENWSTGGNIFGETGRN